jgi:hypothetical protein
MADLLMGIVVVQGQGRTPAGMARAWKSEAAMSINNTGFRLALQVDSNHTYVTLLPTRYQANG